jgi:CxxC motif-containing protein (DUF1111 family)
LAAADPHLQTVQRTEQEALRVADIMRLTADFSRPERFEGLPGGAATVRLRETSDAFSQSSGNMPFERELDFKVGNGLFKKLWVSSPSSTLASDGLGPLYNARSCQRCHLKDGRGHPPLPNAPTTSMFLRLSIPAVGAEVDRYGAFPTIPEPTYGEQFQDFAVPGLLSEGQWSVEYEESQVILHGGEVVSLRRPHYEIELSNFGALHPDTLISPRIAPQMIGLGLLEAIPEADILSWADPDDLNNDGISGRANWVDSHEFPKQKTLGRFGLKAGSPTVKNQSAGAFSGDMGISNPLYPQPFGECTERQTDCLSAPHGGSPAHGGFEISEEGLELVTFYSRNLAVPERRNLNDSEVLRGKHIFYDIGCVSCHRPKFVTHRLSDRPEQSFQLIWPYTDMLLHDMGEGLADGRPEFVANGSEWRTPPLWGVGLTEMVSGHTYFLHDGRARSLLEAIVWHGGEAGATRDRFVGLPKRDRDALIAFVKSL